MAQKLEMENCERRKAVKKSVPPVSSSFSFCYCKGTYLLGSCRYYTAESEEHQYPDYIHPSQRCSAKAG